jgi:hypothetical protein
MTDFFLPWRESPVGLKLPHYRGLMMKFRQTTLGRTRLDEWSARRTELYLTTHNNRKRQTSIPPVGFKPIIPASKRQQNNAFRSHGHWKRQNIITTILKPPLFYHTYIKCSFETVYKRNMALKFVLKIFIIVPCKLFQSLLYCCNSCNLLHVKTLKSHTETLKIRPYTFRSTLKPSSGGLWPYFATLLNWDVDLHLL